MRALATAAFAVMIIALAQQAAQAASADKGKALFVSKGCWQCHGFAGQGGAGAPLAPNPMPLDAMKAFVRNTNGRMPPYTAAVLSDEDLADIHAYLESVPKPPDYKGVPLLNP